MARSACRDWASQGRCRACGSRSNQKFQGFSRGVSNTAMQWPGAGRAPHCQSVQPVSEPAQLLQHKGAWRQSNLTSFVFHFRGLSGGGRGMSLNGLGPLGGAGLRPALAAATPAPAPASCCMLARSSWSLSKKVSGLISWSACETSCCCIFCICVVIAGHKNKQRMWGLDLWASNHRGCFPGCVWHYYS